MMEERYRETTQNRFYLDMSNVNEMGWACGMYGAGERGVQGSDGET